MGDWRRRCPARAADAQWGIVRYVLFAAMLFAIPSAVLWARSHGWIVLLGLMVVVLVVAVRFPAAWSDVRRLNSPDGDLLAAAEAALAAMRVRSCEGTDTSLHARVPTNCSSWGERIDVRIRGGIVECRSRCVFGLVDWGKNRRNVGKFFCALADVLEASQGATAQVS